VTPGTLSRDARVIRACVRAVFVPTLTSAVGETANTLQMEKADARTRTGDPFITSYGQLSARVTASHLRRFVTPKSSGLEVTLGDPR
jgi:hypothetical protein